LFFIKMTPYVLRKTPAPRAAPFRILAKRTLFQVWVGPAESMVLGRVGYETFGVIQRRERDSIP
jgi:hypothetical protein